MMCPLTFEQMKALSPEHQKELYYSIGGRRATSKTTNFSCQYNAYPKKIASTAGLPLPEATELWNVYWERNWALKEVVHNLRVRRVRDQLWQWNPVAELWYFLKAKKDQFSTLNQGTGSYVFDTYLKHARKVLPGIVCVQYHDELLVSVPIGKREEIRMLLDGAMELANEELRLNVVIEHDGQFGWSYADVH